MALRPSLSVKVTGEKIMRGHLLGKAMPGKHMTHPRRSGYPYLFLRKGADFLQARAEILLISVHQNRMLTAVPCPGVLVRRIWA